MLQWTNEDCWKQREMPRFELQISTRTKAAVGVKGYILIKNNYEISVSGAGRPGQMQINAGINIQQAQSNVSIHPVFLAT